jgi:NAD+ kinase
MAAIVDRLRGEIEKYVTVAGEDFEYATDLEKVDADFALVFGGDGSILRSAHQMGENQIPVLGVNLGKLGFLADLQVEDLISALEDIGAGNYQIVEHLMIRCQVFDGEKLLADEIGLNEVAIMGGPPFSIQYIDLYVDGELATTYSCDGLIISTPVGSTAHNLSAGGPILRKNLQAFVVSPISPHTLTVRPVVDGAERIYDIVVRESNKSTSALLDGRVVSQLTPKHRVRVQRAEQIFKLVEISGRGYYRTLREKLGWAGEFNKNSPRNNEK